MTLKELRKKNEEILTLLLVHQSNDFLIASLCTDGRYYYVFQYEYENSKWTDKIMVMDKDSKEPFRIFQTYLTKENLIKDYEGGLIFTCPDCKCNVLECVENGNYTSDILNIQPEGDFDYGIITANGDVERFQCRYCGHILTDENYEPITDNLEVVEWIKENCLPDTEKQ